MGQGVGCMWRAGEAQLVGGGCRCHGGHGHRRQVSNVCGVLGFGYGAAASQGTSRAGACLLPVRGEEVCTCV